MNDDAAARFYTKSFSRDLERPQAAVELNPHNRYFTVRNALQEFRAANVLELGYGMLPNVKAMAEVVDGEYHIIDIVDRTRGDAVPDNVKLIVSNLDHEFPVSGGSFDAVVALMVVEHLYDPFHAFSEIARVLRPGGRAYINLPNVASIKCRVELLRGRMPITSSSDWFEKREWDGNHLHYFVISDVIRLGKLVGLDLIDIYTVGKFRWLKKLWPSLFCHELNFVFERS